MIQWIICLCGMATVHLLARTDKRQKYGYIVGLCSEPFWIIASLTAEPKQWGIAVLAVYYGWQYWLGWRRRK
jgi:hypothetical protein